MENARKNAKNDGIITPNFTQKEKDNLIKKEIQRLTELFGAIEEDKQAMYRGMIEEAAFMAITLLDLRKTINKDGVTSVYQNGENQWGTKKSPEIEIYNILIKNYMSLMKQMADAFPKTDLGGNTEIMEFIKK